jgi:hypothetical protein
VGKGMRLLGGGASSLTGKFPWMECGEDGEGADDPWLLFLGPRYEQQ